LCSHRISLLYYLVFYYCCYFISLFARPPIHYYVAVYIYIHVDYNNNAATPVNVRVAYICIICIYVCTFEYVYKYKYIQSDSPITFSSSFFFDNAVIQNLIFGNFNIRLNTMFLNSWNFFHYLFFANTNFCNSKPSPFILLTI